MRDARRAPPAGGAREPRFKSWPLHVSTPYQAVITGPDLDLTVTGSPGGVAFALHALADKLAGSGQLAPVGQAGGLVKPPKPLPLHPNREAHAAMCSCGYPDGCLVGRTAEARRVRTP